MHYCIHAHKNYYNHQFIINSTDYVLLYNGKSIKTTDVFCTRIYSYVEVVICYQINLLISVEMTYKFKKKETKRNEHRNIARNIRLLTYINIIYYINTY